MEGEYSLSSGIHEPTLWPQASDGNAVTIAFNISGLSQTAAQSCGTPLLVKAQRERRCLQLHVESDSLHAEVKLLVIT